MTITVQHRERSIDPSTANPRETRVIRRSIDTGADPATVWTVLADFGNIARWSSGVKQSHLVSDVPSGLGAHRHCDLSMGMTVREEIVHWLEHEELGIKFTKFSMPAKEATATFRLTKTSRGTRVDFEMAFQPRGITRLMAPLLQRMMGANLEALLDDLKTESETRTKQRA